MDDTHHVITGACASTAGSKDSENLAEILEQTIDNLASVAISINQIAADAGYSSGKALQFCEDQDIDAYIPNFGQYKPEREGFIYNPALDQYECIQVGEQKAHLPFKGIKTDNKGYEIKHYRSSESSCKDCPLREACCGKVINLIGLAYQKLVESIHKPLYDCMHKKLNQNRSYSNKIAKI